MVSMYFYVIQIILNQIYLLTDGTLSVTTNPDQSLPGSIGKEKMP